MIIRLAFSILAIVFLASCSSTKKTTAVKDMVPVDQRLAESTINMDIIKSHIGFLAADELKGRDTGSEGLNIAANYISSFLQRTGVKTFDGLDGYFQNVPLQNVTAPSGGSFTFGNNSLALPDGFVMIRGGNLEASGEIVYANRGSEADLEGLDVAGKIVVVSCGFEGEDSPQQWFFAGRSKREMIKEKGAAALVEIYNNAQLPYNFLKGYLNASRTVVKDESEDEGAAFPHIWLNGAEEEIIAKLKEADGQEANVSIDGIQEDMLDTKNIVGYLEGSDPALKDEYIIYSAHYDHVGIGREIEGDSIYNGTRDNAVGTVTVLSAAENIAKYPTKRSALFIFFTGEEKGLLGSAYYADNPVVPLNQMTYCFNSDNAGYNDTSKAMIIGLERTHADKFISKACTAFGLEAIKDNMPEQNLFDRSDNVNFAQKGVPAPTFGMGITAMDDEVNRYYHKPQDNPDSVDYEYLVKFFKSYVYACRLIANTTESVFWKEGDKYYEAGVELYGETLEP